MYIKTVTVSDLNKYIKSKLDSDFILNSCYIKGEISNLKIHFSGHIYFSLKDQHSKIKCVMFKSYAKNLQMDLKDGMEVIVYGQVSLYEKDGVYQLYCKNIEQQGLGKLYVEFEKLKDSLKNEGLFNEEFKKTIPKFPKKIGIITSPTGAAVKDIINVATRRNNSLDLVIYKAKVQGEDASKTIINGIKKLNQIEDIDVIIIARGGGSIEELWAFNDKDLAYEVFKSKKPIVTGVGHETDFTIVDFVGDKRAPTPSAAAEVVIYSKEEWENNIKNFRKKMTYNLQNKLIKEKNNLKLLNERLNYNSPSKIILNQYKNIDNIMNVLNLKMKNKIDYEKERLVKFESLLQAHNPLNVLKKGYTLIKDEKNNLIDEKNKLLNKKDIQIVFKDGNVNLTIEHIKKDI